MTTAEKKPITIWATEHNRVVLLHETHSDTTFERVKVESHYKDAMGASSWRDPGHQYHAGILEQALLEFFKKTQ